jgi:lipid-A-disaccharide synthase-like uncharacterized protein
MNTRIIVPAVIVVLVFAAAAIHAGSPGTAADPRDSGLSTAWLVFGFAAQAVFGLRFLIQWIASERAKESVVPRGFWVLSLVGGVALFFYFLRRGDPVGMAGQIFGVIVYARNLYLLVRKERQPASTPAAPPAAAPPPAAPPAAAPPAAAPPPAAPPAAAKEPVAHG